MTDRYESPLASRYASDYMLNLFSSDTRYQTWRKLWVALAREESRLGLPITQEQVAELAEALGRAGPGRKPARAADHTGTGGGTGSTHHGYRL